MTRTQASSRSRGTIHALLEGAIDYAGLFPPASLDMATVVANYHDYRRSSDAWSLGRLVIPAAGLAELATHAMAHWGEARDASGGLWRISALVGSDARADAALVAAFNAEHRRHAVVDSVETRAGTPAEIQSLGHIFGHGAGPYRQFVEIPVDDRLQELVSAIRAIGACAKIRSGGVAVDAFPTPLAVARFLRACADAGVPFKATAGLHHPLRGRYPLTYAPGSATGTMFGYLNIFLAAAQAQDGAPVDALVATLEIDDAASLALGDGDVRWGRQHAALGALAAMRDTFALSFGSCSFREPLDDLDTLIGS